MRAIRSKGDHLRESGLVAVHVDAEGVSGLFGRFSAGNDMRDGVEKFESMKKIQRLMLLKRTQSTKSISRTRNLTSLRHSLRIPRIDVQQSGSTVPRGKPQLSLSIP